ncbi:MAG: hypothetical protein ACREDK_05625 [Thermoplasmata archaeon]
MPSSSKAKRSARSRVGRARPSPSKSHARPRSPSKPVARPHRAAPRRPPAKPAARPSVRPLTKKPTPAPSPSPQSTAPPRGDGRRHVLSLSFLRDGDEFLARLETDAGQITELKNRSLDQLLTLVANELEDLLE